MNRSKKIFIVFGAVFLILVFYASYDIGTRTTFPGSKPQPKEQIQNQNIKKDTLPIDTSKSFHR